MLSALKEKEIIYFKMRSIKRKSSLAYDPGEKAIIIKLRPISVEDINSVLSIL